MKWRRIEFFVGLESAAEPRPWDILVARARAAISEAYAGFTWTETIGQWDGAEERSARITVLHPARDSAGPGRFDFEQAQATAEALAVRLGQESVWFTYEPAVEIGMAEVSRPAEEGR